MEDPDREGLRSGSDSNSAILKFFPREHPVWQESPLVSDVVTSMEETLTTIEEEPLPPIILPMWTRLTNQSARIDLVII